MTAIVQGFDRDEDGVLNDGELEEICRDIGYDEQKDIEAAKIRIKSSESRETRIRSSDPTPSEELPLTVDDVVDYFKSDTWRCPHDSGHSANWHIFQDQEAIDQTSRREATVQVSSETPAQNCRRDHDATRLATERDEWETIPLPSKIPFSPDMRSPERRDSITDIRTNSPAKYRNIQTNLGGTSHRGDPPSHEHALPESKAVAPPGQEPDSAEFIRIFQDPVWSPGPTCHDPKGPVSIRPDPGTCTSIEQDTSTSQPKILGVATGKFAHSVILRPNLCSISFTQSVIICFHGNDLAEDLEAGPRVSHGNTATTS